jgi:hypothetical protein
MKQDLGQSAMREAPARGRIVADHGPFQRKRSASALASWDRGVWRGSGRDEIVQAQFRRSGAGLPVMRTKPCASARGLAAAPVKWPGSRSLGVVLKAAT